MALFTSYLGFLNRGPSSLRDTTRLFMKNHHTLTLRGFEFIYVARNRGNDEVAPPEMVLRLAKEGAITWEGYRDAYLDSLNRERSIEWMRRVAEKAKDRDVVLICFEKDAEHCHRTLLAKEIAKRFDVEYRGELSAGLES